MNLQTVESIFTIALAIGQFPLWAFLFKLANLPTRLDAVDNEISKFKKEIRDKHKDLEDKYNDLVKEMNTTTLKSIEVMSAINSTLAELKTSIIGLNNNISQSEKYVSKIIDNLQKDINQHREATAELVNKLIDANGKD